MYFVWFMDNNGNKRVAGMDDTPLFFNEDYEAWNFIDEVMSSGQHPKFMWIERVNANANT